MAPYWAQSSENNRDVVSFPHKREQNQQGQMILSKEKWRNKGAQRQTPGNNTICGQKEREITEGAQEEVGTKWEKAVIEAQERKSPGQRRIKCFRKRPVRWRVRGANAERDTHSPEFPAGDCFLPIHLLIVLISLDFNYHLLFFSFSFFSFFSNKWL